MGEIRLLVDSPAPGAWNMAVDEVLLETAAATGRATLRFYAWSEPTLSLGYFQAASSREEHPASLACSLVRRASGGGAILHDRELTYSVALPLGGASRGAASELYTLVHESLVSVLAEFGVTAVIQQAATFCRGDWPSESGREPFLCFERRTCGDIICEGAKIVGSAQRRRRGAVLQHGSVLLGRSLFALELPGIAELAGVEIRPRELALASAERVSHRLRLSLQPESLSAAEQHAAAAVEASRFAAAEYVHRR